MGTRSFISIKNPDNTYDTVYCHFDGYPDGVGKKLENHYGSEDKVRELIARGDMSSLAAKVDDCEFYTKRGEPLKNLVNIPFEELVELAKATWCEYLYTFDEGTWTHQAL
jgi:hypothetical protein